MFRSVTVVGGVTLHEECCNDVVASSGVGRKMRRPIEQCARLGPQVMMRVDDRSMWIDGRLDHLIEPSLVSCGKGSIGHAPC